MNTKKTLICAGLLLLTLPNRANAADKKAIAQEATAATLPQKNNFLQPPATPRLQSPAAAMPPATPACAAATASTHRSSPTTATSQPSQVSTKEEYESALVYNQKSGKYEPQVRRKSIISTQTKPHHRYLQSDAHGMPATEILQMIAAAQHRQSQQNTPRHSPTPKKSGWFLCSCLCSASDENAVTQYSAT